jgi:RHS repeat-associated protein
MSVRTAQARPQRIIGLLLLGLALGASPVYSATLTRTSSFAYDAATGLLTKEVIEPDTSTLCVVTEYTYDAYGNKTAASTRNCNGSSGEAAVPTGDAVIQSSTTSNTYDARGQFPVSSSNALAQSESKTFDPKWGTPLSLTGPNGLTTNWQYDNFGRKTKEIRADGTQTKWDYLYCNGITGGVANCPSVGGAAGAWLVQETPLASDGVTANGPISKTYYDALNRRIRKETQGYDGSGVATAIYQDTQYDSLGRPYMKSRPYYAGQTTYWVMVSYDSIGRPLQETQPDNSVTSTVYNGLTTTITNAKSQIRTTVKNSQGQIVRVTDAQNQSLTYTYDPFGNLTTTTDPAGNVVTLSYDLKGRKIQMVDPDMGTWTYAYNALGQLVRQTDAKGQVSTLAYDKLGRLISRSEADLISNWYYDSYKNGVVCNKGVGKLCQSETSTGYNKAQTYDNLGRQVSSATTVDVPTPYSAAVTYDANGRVQTQTYPTGLVVKYVFTTLGYLKEVRDNASNALYWQANSLDAEGHLLQQTYGNSIQTTQSYNPANGRISAIQSGTGNNVQNLSYQYDALGNITARGDANQSLSESFVYDSLNRLTSSTVNSSGAGIVTQTLAYSALGNITSKSDLGTYTYPASGASSIRPHAVRQIALADGSNIAFAYDANGALTTQSQVDAQSNAVPTKSRSQFYTSFNMPQSMGQGTTSAAFYYGPEHQRVKQISSVQGATVYVNPGNEGALFYEKDTKPDNSIEQRAFITAGGQVVAIVKALTSGGTTTTSVRYMHRDNLGSVTAITDESGTVVERLAYEPFGKRRFANGANDPNNTLLPQNTDRGFTGHEMLDEIGLIHMNGRVYDPLVGRFLSADPHIQSPGSLQSYNRYTYVGNNPLNSTDPSGYFNLGSWFKASTTAFMTGDINRDIPTAANFVRNQPGQQYIDQYVMTHSWAYSLGQAVATYFTAYCGGCGGAAWAIYYTYESTGSVDAALKAGVIAYATSYAETNLSGFELVAAKIAINCANAAMSHGNCGTASATSLINYATGEITGNKLAADAISSCAKAVMSHTDCGKSALSSIVNDVFKGNKDQLVLTGGFVSDLIIRSVVGGTVSVIGGDKFANGAKTEAFDYIIDNQKGPYRAYRQVAARAILDGTNAYLSHEKYGEIALSGASNQAFDAYKENKKRIIESGKSTQTTTNDGIE